MPREYQAMGKGLLMACYGMEKTGKSYFALTAPKPLVYFETDPGSFDRAFNGYQRTAGFGGDVLELDTREPTEQFDSQIFLYRAHFLDEGRAGNLVKWIVDRIVDASNDEKLKTIVIDTGDILWSAMGSARYNEVVTISDKERKQLHATEYAKCNTAMTALYWGIRMSSKNLITIHHTAAPESYKVMEGWKRTGQMSDIVGEFRIVNPSRPGEIGSVVEMKVHSNGLDISKTGGIMRWPTYDTLVEAIKGQ